jgi:hypothetical protein
MKTGILMGVLTSLGIIAFVLLLALSQAPNMNTTNSTTNSFNVDIPLTMWGQPSSLTQAEAIVGPLTLPTLPSGMTASGIRVNPQTQIVIATFYSQSIPLMAFYNASVVLFVFGNITTSVPSQSGSVPTCKVDNISVSCAVQTLPSPMETKVTVSGHSGMEWVGSAASGIGWTAGRNKYVLMGQLPLKTLLKMAVSMGT